MIDENDAVDPIDEDLRDDLRAADPARSLPPLTAAAVDRLLEESMSGDPTRPDPTTSRPPRRTALLVAAAAVVVAGVGGLAWAVLGPDRTAGGGSTGRAVDPGRTAPASPSAGAPAGGSTDTAPGSGSVTTLSIPREGAARCMVPSAAVLAGQDLAVLATVRSADDATVVLDVDRWYAGPSGGPETPTVEVDAVEPSLQDLLLAPDLQPGEQYLLAATGGLVTLCGSSGPATPALQGLYDEAFG